MRRLVGLNLVLLVLLVAAVISSGSLVTGESIKLSSSVMPIPSSEAGLPTIMAEPWLQVDGDPMTMLEGPAFDRQGNLFLLSTLDGRVWKVTPEKAGTVIFANRAIMPAGMAIHKDGRLFIVAVSGQIFSINPDGSGYTEVKARINGNPKQPDDLVFDSKGNLYVTDVAGTISEPTGGVYRYSADFQTVTPIYENMAAANGISLSPYRPDIYPQPLPYAFDLWVAESARNSIVRLRMMPDGITPAHPRATYPYQFTGDAGPDSNKVDSNGNVYQAIGPQGRILILNNAGIPIAQVLIPGRDQGKNLVTTNLAFKPGTDEAYVTSSGTDGGWIFKFKALAEGASLFSHQD